MLNRFQTSLIRNAAAIAAFIADDTGKVIEMSTVTNSLPSAYYYANGGTWQNTTAGLSWNKRLSSLGLTEGEQITVGLVAVPEYYETGPHRKPSCVFTSASWAQALSKPSP